MTRALAALCAACLTAAAPDLVYRDVYLMGTRARLSVYAANRDAGFATLENALRILEHAERELTTWSDDSEISTLNRTAIGTAWHANDALCRMFADVYAWHSRTNGAFDPGVWAGRRGGLTKIVFDHSSCDLTPSADVRLDVGGFGKGEALDRVVAAMPGVPWMIDLGGQVSVGAPPPQDSVWTVDVAHPLDRARVAMQVRMRSGSLSTSGTSERGPHIDNPRTGAPSSFTGSVVVWHESGLVADMLSTALHVMGPDEGHRWAVEHDIAACFLIADGAGVRRKATPPFATIARR